MSQFFYLETALYITIWTSLITFLILLRSYSVSMESIHIETYLELSEITQHFRTS